jgi:hypothetical protein
MRTEKRSPFRAATLAVAGLMLATGLTSCIATFGPRGWRHDHDRGRQHSRYQRRDQDRRRDDDHRGDLSIMPSTSMPNHMLSPTST